MAKELKDFQQLLIDTVKILKKVIKEVPDAPIKMFDFLADIKDNFEEIEELNKNEGLFEQADDEEKEEFSVTLEKFLAYTEKHRVDEGSLLHPILKQETILMTLADLDRRYEKLNG
jgi:uncharacterized protein YicC (UPF0701 family)